MATAAQCYAVFWISIVFHVINVMDVVSPLLANKTSVVVSLSNLIFKSPIKCLWVWLKRQSATPRVRLIQNAISCVTNMRAKIIFITRGLRDFLFKMLSAIYTSKVYPLLSSFIVTIFRTINSSSVILVNIKFSSATRTGFYLISSLPPRGFISRYFIGGLTRFRTILRCFKGVLKNKVFFSAFFTNQTVLHGLDL